MNDMSSKRLQDSAQKPHIRREISTVTHPSTSGAFNQPHPNKLSQTQQTRNLPYKIERRNITSPTAQSAASSSLYPSLTSRATGSSYARQLYANSTKSMRNVPQSPENNEGFSTPQPPRRQNMESRRYSTPVGDSAAVLSGVRPERNERTLSRAFDFPHQVDHVAMSLYRSSIMQQYADTSDQPFYLDPIYPSTSAPATRPRSMNANMARNSLQPVSHSYEVDYIQASSANPPAYISTAMSTSVADSPASNERLSGNTLYSRPLDILNSSPDHALFSSMIDGDEVEEEEIPPYVLNEETPCYTESDTNILYACQGTVQT